MISKPKNKEFLKLFRSPNEIVWKNHLWPKNLMQVCVPLSLIITDTEFKQFSFDGVLTILTQAILTKQGLVMLPRTCLFPLWIPRLLYFSHNNSSSMSVTAILVAGWNTELVLPAWRDTTDHPATTPVLYQCYILLSVHFCLCRNILS